MITSLFFMQLISFQLWYATSKQVKHVNPPTYLRSILNNRRRFRTLGGIIFLLSTVFFIGLWGWMSGICASIVGLMGVGSLVVTLQPFGYFTKNIVLVIYLCCLMLEIFI